MVAPLYGSDDYVRLEEEVEEVEAVYGHAFGDGGDGGASAGTGKWGKQLETVCLNHCTGSLPHYLPPPILPVPSHCR